jgi:hypothetical protein
VVVVVSVVAVVPPLRLGGVPATEKKTKCIVFSIVYYRCNHNNLSDVQHVAH